MSDIVAIRKLQQNIIEKDNTAQTNLLGILEKMDTNITHLEITRPLSGNLDFSVLENQGYKKVKSIALSDYSGQVTNISNLPEKLEKLVCHNQRLMDLENLPETLIELDCQNNHISHLDLSRLTKLKILRITANNFEELENLPNSLEELYAGKNKIKHINLRDLIRLRVLNISENKTVIVENLPPSVVDFNCEGNPYIEVRDMNMYDANYPDVDEDTIHRRMDYIESIYDYFKLRRRYNEKNHKDKKKAFARGKSLQIKRKLAARVVPKCIQCNRPGGTLFYMKNHTHYALCGATDPCSLKIQIYNGNHHNHSDLIQLEGIELQTIKQNIIRQKLDTIFNYLSEEASVKKFNEYMEEFTYYNADYNELLDKNNKLYFDEEREEKIRKKTETIYELIDAIKQLMVQYEKDQNRNLLQNAIEIQIKELDPEIQNLRRLKYEITEMKSEQKRSVLEEGEDATEADNASTKKGGKTMSVLFQRYAALTKMQVMMGKPPEVVKYSYKA